MFVVDSVHETVFIVVSPSNQQMPGRPGPPKSERRPGSGSGMWLQRSEPGMVFLIVLGSDSDLQVTNTFSCWQNAPIQHLIGKRAEFRVLFKQQGWLRSPGTLLPCACQCRVLDIIISCLYGMNLCMWLKTILKWLLMEPLIGIIHWLTLQKLKNLFQSDCCTGI